MRVFCNLNNGKTFPTQLLSLGYTFQSSFTISVGKEYQVYAMVLWQGVILLLLDDDHHLPNWFPMNLFSVSDSHLPASWSFLPLTNDHHGVQAMWGYERLIADETHYDGLLERDAEAIRYFYEEVSRPNVQSTSSDHRG